MQELKLTTEVDKVMVRKTCPGNWVALVPSVGRRRQEHQDRKKFPFRFHECEPKGELPT